jgi:tetratricopeptide (TPR) repeat protein
MAVLFCGPLVLGVAAVRAWAKPVEAAYSCGSLRSMARVYMASGGYQKAQPFLERALHLAQGTNASDCERCACMLDLAYLYKNQGRLDEAERMCRSGLELQEKVYHEGHPYVAHTLRILSEIHRGQARYREARSALERAIAIMRTVHSDDDPQVAPFQVDWARLLVEQGRYADAESCFEKVIALIENSYGPEHLYTTKVLSSMARLYVLQERYPQAEELIGRILPIQEKIYGPDHHLLVPTWLLMAQIDRAKGDLAHAKMLLDRCSAAVEEQTDCGYLIEVEVLTGLGEFHLLSKEYTEAEEVLQKALRILDSSQGTDSDRMAIALDGLARVYIHQGQHDRAQSLCRRALDILQSVFDEHHPKVADVLETLVQVYARMGNNAEAARLQQRAEEIRVRHRADYTPVAKALE